MAHCMTNTIASARAEYGLFPYERQAEGQHESGCHRAFILSLLHTAVPQFAHAGGESDCRLSRALPWQPVMKVQIAEKHPSGAKAHRLLSSICGTTKVVPFQNLTFTTGC
jgi:hypothetical protein